jgi:uncharacterized membrane protein
MSIVRQKSLILVALLSLLLFAAFLQPAPARAAGEITLHTPYRNITVNPADSVSYTIDVINNTSDVISVPISVSGIPQGWEYKLTSGSWSISEIGVKGNESATVRLELEIPQNVQKGRYNFSVVAQGYTSLPLTVNVAETGVFETEFTTKQPNREGDADANFSFTLDLRNRTAEEQTYALTSEAPRGWNVEFRVSGNSVTSATVEPGATASVTVNIKPPQGITEGSYKIPVTASAGNTSASTELEVVITGKYDMLLTTPRGLLSAEVTAGRTTKVELEIRNTGTTALTDVELDYTAPIGWEVTFDNDKIDRIEAGESAKAVATIKASDKAIPGDYETNITASTPEVSSEAKFRITVKTSMLWGWLGILIIVAVIGGIYYLFRKYGRR